MKKSRKDKWLSKKALMSVIALSVGATASQAAIPTTDSTRDGLFNLQEVSSQSILIAEEGDSEEGKSGGENKAEETEVKTTESKCGIKKFFRKIFHKKEATTATESTEAKCGEGTCG